MTDYAEQDHGDPQILIYNNVQTHMLFKAFPLYWKIDQLFIKVCYFVYILDIYFSISKIFRDSLGLLGCEPFPVCYHPARTSYIKFLLP